MSTEHIPAPLIKYYEAAIQDGPCGPSEAIAMISTSRVDRDGEVVVPSGVVLGNYRMNPIVQYGHAKGLPEEGEAGLPIATNLWIKPSRDGFGLVAKHKFDTDDDFARRICGKVKRGVLRCYSITFLPLEYGPPTRDEVAKNPSWANAKTVYRKVELIEYSVVAMPANVDAVTLAKRGKLMSEPEKVAAEDEPETATPDVDVDADAADDPVEKAMPRDDPDGDGDDDSSEAGDDDGDADELPFKRGDHVKCFAPHAKGHGMVLSVHKNGMVPDVEEDIFGSRDRPACRVRMYKKVDGGHLPTKVCKGMMCKHVEACDALTAPKRKKAVGIEPLRPEPTWTAAERAAYVTAMQQTPEFKARIEKCVVDAFETRVLGKV